MRAERADEEAVDSLIDVPAAVLCAFCGQADCPGCSSEVEQGSGVVAIVPWERPGAGTWNRLWATANATTRGAEAFFSALPDGDVSPAFRFAVLAEILAVGSFAPFVLLLLGVFAALTAPNLLLELVASPAVRSGALRWTTLAIPAFAGAMVLVHATHGAALDVAARRLGARAERRRGVRFGLYSCGWDLMSCPVGVTVALATRGARAALELFELSQRAWRKASLALLSGVYALDPEAAARANRTALRLTLVLVTAGLALTVAGCAAAALL